MIPAKVQPSRAYRRSASPLAVSRTSSDLPDCRAASSAARISAAPTPRRLARRCTNILEMSARWGWFSGWSSATWTVPTMPVTSSATSKARAPLSTSRATRRQNASALASERGCMKLTDAPPSTQSISTSASPCIWASVKLDNRWTVYGLCSALFIWSSHVVGLAHDHDGIARDLARAIVESGGAIENKGKAVTRVELVAIVTNPHVNGPFKHPHLLMHPYFTSAGVECHPSAGRKLNLDDLNRRSKAAG